MDQHKILEELKKLPKKLSENSPNYLIVKFGYDNRMLLPYKAGVALLQALEEAEQYCYSYDGNDKISPFNRENLEMQIMPSDDVRRIRMAQLIGCTARELKDAQEYAAAFAPTS
jgi:hypothetical protein